MRTILRNAKIWLGGDQFASAVLFDSSQILTVGTDADVEAQRQNDDQIIDGQGRLVLPGLCDTHLHCYNKGCTLQNIDLQDVSSIEEIVSRSRDYIQAHPDSSVIHGRGWNHDYFAEGRILNRADLDRISTRVAGGSDPGLRAYCLRKHMRFAAAGIHRGDRPARGRTDRR